MAGEWRRRLPIIVGAALAALALALWLLAGGFRALAERREAGGEASGPCAEARAAALTAKSETTLEGDVDGDGAPDRVFVTSVPDAPAGCSDFVVAHTGSGSIATAFQVGEDHGSPDIPRLLLLAEIDGRAGAEPVVLVARNPVNTRYAAVFTLRDGQLARSGVGGSVGTGRHAFAFKGQGDNVVDCPRRASGLVRTDRSWFLYPAQRRNPAKEMAVLTTLYRLRGTAFRVVSQRKTGLTHAEYRAHRAFRAPDPFSSCTVASAPTPKH